MTKWPSLDDMFHDNSNASVNEQQKQEKSKYCGLCEQYFTNSNIHVESRVHKQNAKDGTKWSNVDALIARQPTPAEFEELLLRKRAKTQGTEH